MRENVLLLLLGAALIFSFLGFLGWALEAPEERAACWKKRLCSHMRSRQDARTQEERLNEKTLRWVNKDAQARADRRGRTW